MEQAHFLQKLYSRYSPQGQELINLKEKATDWEKLSENEKKKLAEEYLQKTLEINPDFEAARYKLDQL